MDKAFFFFFSCLFIYFPYYRKSLRTFFQYWMNDLIVWITEKGPTIEGTRGVVTLNVLLIIFFIV